MLNTAFQTTNSGEDTTKPIIMPYITPSTQWFIISYMGSTPKDSSKHEYLVEWSDEVDLSHIVRVTIQPTMSLYLHFVSLNYTNLTQKNLSDYLERVRNDNDHTK